MYERRAKRAETLLFMALIHCMDHLPLADDLQRKTCPPVIPDLRQEYDVHRDYRVHILSMLDEDASCTIDLDKFVDWKRRTLQRGEGGEKDDMRTRGAVAECTTYRGDDYARDYRGLATYAINNLPG